MKAIVIPRRTSIERTRVEGAVVVVERTRVVGAVVVVVDLSDMVIHHLSKKSFCGGFVAGTFSGVIGV
jgi:hypothetical protein